MKKSESKYFHTAVRMDEALLSLLERKNFDFITVKEICEEAGVNRSTFYLHYESTLDLLHECSEYVNQKCFKLYDNEMIKGKMRRIYKSSLKDLVFVTPEFLTPYLNFVRENRRLFKTVVLHTEAFDTQGTFEKIFDSVLEPVLDRFGYKEYEKKYVIAFYVHGLIAIVQEWLKTDCADSIENIIAVITKCTIPDGRMFSDQ